MDFEEFKQSLSSAEPPGDIPAYLLSLWYDAQGDWERSHNIIQDINDTTAAWIHAYLHRKEGILVMLITGIIVPAKKDLPRHSGKNGNLSPAVSFNKPYRAAGIE